MRVLRDGADGIRPPALERRDLRAGLSVRERAQARERPDQAPLEHRLHGHGRTPGELPERRRRRQPHQLGTGNRREKDHGVHRRGRSEHQEAVFGGHRDAPGPARGLPSLRRRRREDETPAGERPVRRSRRAHDDPEGLHRHHRSSRDARMGPHRAPERRRRYGAAAREPRPQARSAKGHGPRERHPAQSDGGLRGRQAEQPQAGQRLLRLPDERVRHRGDPEGQARNRHRRRVRSAESQGPEEGRAETAKGSGEAVARGGAPCGRRDAFAF
mmetsp:Transcript_1358/g.3365  ORF Transcript_1358/g.3365 Transcript_1358/m.3365 type:complete len:272 (-) Transcript_1358:196-1011(-)